MAALTSDGAAGLSGATGGDGTSAAAAVSGASRLVIKIGSALLVDAGTGKLRRSWLEGVAADIAALRAGGAPS